MTLKPCCYCHKRPRVNGTAYCADPNCATKKREQNRRSQRKYRANEKEQRAEKRQADIAAGRRIDDEARATLQDARAVLHERDDASPRRLTPVVVVTKYRSDKDKAYKVTI